MTPEAVAEIQRLEARLLELASELEAARRGREQAERSNQARDAYLASAAHDLRNPLNAIAGWAHLLRELDPAGPDFRAGLEAIVANVRIQARQIDELADLAALATTGLHVALGPVDLRPLVEAACRAASTSARAQQIEVAVAPRTASAPVLADAQRIDRILSDLLGHAAAATPPGNRVDVETACDGHQVEVRIAAPCATLPAEKLAQLFELFAVPEPRGRRTGPPLAIARAVAELHGGALEAGPCVGGRGLRFVLRLPLELTDDAG